jgi:ribonuclease VapC
VIVIDTSALVAILANEPEKDQLLDLLWEDPHPLISTLTVLEATLVLEGRRGRETRYDLDLLLSKLEIKIVPFDLEQLRLARQAFRMFGTGRHPAQLNLGDCCVYGLARKHSCPVLCKGADFSQTDITVLPG